MRRQLQGIALILIAILLTIGYGDEYFLNFSWAMIFKLVGLVGVALVFWPEKKNK